MTPRLMTETFCFAPAQTLASPSTVRWSLAVDSTIELACTGAPGVAHMRKARAALSALWPQNSCQWAAAWPPVPHLGSVESARGTSGPSEDFFNFM